MSDQHNPLVSSPYGHPFIHTPAIQSLGRSRRDLRPDLLSLAPVRALAFRLLDRTAGARHRRLGQLLSAAGDRTNLGAPAECGGLRDHTLRPHEHRRTKSDAWLSPERIHPDEMRPGKSWDPAFRIGTRPSAPVRERVSGLRPPVPATPGSSSTTSSVTDAAAGLSFGRGAARRSLGRRRWLVPAAYAANGSVRVFRPVLSRSRRPAVGTLQAAGHGPPAEPAAAAVSWRGRLIG